MKRLLLMLTLLILLVTFSMPVFADGHCMDELGCVEVGPDDPIVIAAMLPISGAISFFGEDSQGGVELAILARDGAVLGRDIELVVEDDLCSSEGGQAAAQRITADETILGIIGPGCSSSAQGALPIISDAGMLTISSTNTSPSLTSDDTEAGGVHRPVYFRVIPNDIFQGAMTGQFAFRELQAKTLATIHDGDSYTENLVAIMADTFAEMGGEVVFRGAVSKGDTDMTAILTEVAATSPDVVFFPLFPPESEFLAAQLINIPGLEDSIMMTGDASMVATFPQNTGAAAVGVYISGPFITGDAYEAFLDTWEVEIGGTPPSGFHAHAYDATNLLLDAVEAVAEAAEDGSLIIGRQALRDAIADVENYEGLTGILTCQDESPFAGDCASNTGLAIFEVTEEVVYGDLWPPPPVWNLSMVTMNR